MDTATDVKTTEVKTTEVKTNQILRAIQAEVDRNKTKRIVPEINYSDHCDWHDSGTGDCNKD